jgi:hypothetical protein
LMSEPRASQSQPEARPRSFISAQRLLTSPIETGECVCVETYRRAETGHPRLEPRGRDRRPHVPSSKTNHEKERRLAPTGICRSGQSSRAVGSASSGSFVPLQTKRSDTRRRLRRRHMATPPAPVNSFFRSPAEFFRGPRTGGEPPVYAPFVSNQPVAQINPSPKSTRRPNQPVAM